MLVATPLQAPKQLLCPLLGLRKLLKSCFGTCGPGIGEPRTCGARSREPRKGQTAPFAGSYKRYKYRKFFPDKQGGDGTKRKKNTRPPQQKKSARS
jgi:hypothetical protein